jgi:DNA-binding response OmpR family regulator
MAKNKILIVEDDSYLVKAITIRLEANGFEIVVAVDGEDGLAKSRSEKPDLIILDVMLPKMDGFDICRKLKIDKQCKDIPIIILTAKFQPSDIRFGTEMGADAYMTKPFDSQALLAKIKELLKKR